MSKNEFSPNEQAFIDWLATPESERRIKTQEQLADVLGLHRMTLSRWKQREDISRAVAGRIFLNWFYDKEF